RPLVAVEQEVLPGELSLPRVGHHLVLRGELISPHERLVIEPATCRELPFGFCRQLLADPRRVRLGVFVRDLGDWVPIASVQGAAWALWMPPPGTRHVLPPVAGVAQSDQPA